MESHEQPIDRAATVARVRRIVSAVEQVERRLRRGDAGNLTYRTTFHALAMARELLRDLEPEGDE